MLAVVLLHIKFRADVEGSMDASAAPAAAVFTRNVERAEKCFVVFGRFGGKGARSRFQKSYR